MGAAPKLLLFAFVLIAGCALVYWLIDSKYKRLSAEIDKYEQEYAAKKKDYILEKARWEIKLKPENLDRALRNHGLAMQIPAPTQIVRIGADGRMIPGQPSEARVKRIFVTSASITR
jgi:hypothetical protein